MANAKAAAPVTLDPAQVAALESIIPQTPAAPDPTATAATVGATIDAWFNQTISNSPVARSVDAYNYLFNSLPALKDALAAALA